MTFEGKEQELKSMKEELTSLDKSREKTSELWQSRIWESLVCLLS